MLYKILQHYDPVEFKENPDNLTRHYNWSIFFRSPDMFWICLISSNWNKQCAVLSVIHTNTSLTYNTMSRYCFNYGFNKYYWYFKKNLKLLILELFYKFLVKYILDFLTILTKKYNVISPFKKDQCMYAFNF